MPSVESGAGVGVSAVTALASAITAVITFTQFEFGSRSNSVSIKVFSLALNNYMDFIGKENIVELVQTKLGLKPDGVDGPVTWNTIAAKFGVVTDTKISQISDKAFKLIIKYEVGGGEAYYNKYLKKPSWPGAFSGVTIGVGYDLGYNRTDEL